VMVRKEEIGGMSSRTVRIEVATGRVLLRTSASHEQEMMAQASPRGVASGL